MTARKPAAAAGGDRGRVADVLRGLGALIVLLALLIGLPVLLYSLGGIPIPHRVPSPGQLTDTLTRRDNGQLFLTCLLLLAWAGWGCFAASVAVETAAQLRGRGAPRLPALGGVQRLASHLVAAVAVAFLGTGPALNPSISADPSVVLTATAPAADLAVQAATALNSYSDTTQVATTLLDEPTASPQTLPATTYTVQRGDTLWGIAETHLGDAERYPEIARLNYGRPQPDGRSLTEAHWIYPGWTLLVPADATGLPTSASPGGPDQQSESDPGSSTTSPDPGQGYAPPASDEQPPPATTAPPTTPTRPPASPTATVSAPQPSPPSRLSASRTSGDTNPADETSPPGWADAPLIAATVASGLATALTVLRLRRRRAYQPRPPAPARTDPRPASRLRRLAVPTPASDDDQADDTAPAAEDRPTLDMTPRRLSEVEIGRRDDRAVTLDLLAFPGLSLTGPGSDAVLRSVLADLLARARHYELRILVDPLAAQRLLPDTLPDGDMLQRTPDTAAALMEAEIACVSRSRRLAESGVADYASYRKTYPADPLPLLLLVVADAPAEVAGRLTALLTVGRRLGITALVLGPSPAGMATMSASADGRLLIAEPSTLANQLEGAYFAGLSASDARAALAALAAAVPGDLPPQTERARAPEAIPADEDEDPDWTLQPPIRAQLLGPIRITAWGEEIATGLRGTARELLAYYLLQPDGATAEAAIDALWPDADSERGRQRFWTALGNLRSRLRAPTDNPEIQIIAKHGAHYRANPDLLEVDLWQFQAALADAHRAHGDPQAEAAALQRATDAYRGDLADGTDYPWAEAAREDLHRRALDALVRLADLQHDRPHQAIACLDRAVALDPYAEEIYRRLIRLHAGTGRPDAARRVYEHLRDRLADLDLEPETATIALITGLPEHPRRASRPA